MSDVNSVGGLDIDQDLAAQRREWRIARIAWVVILLVLAAGLAGVFGSGPLAHAEAHDHGLLLEYERIGHRFAPGLLRIHVALDSAAPLELWIDREYLESVELQQITPEPESTRSDAERVVYSFRPAGGARSVTVDVCFEHTRAGRVIGRLGREGESGVTFRQLVYP